MKPTISIAVVAIGLTFHAPALAVDYLQCEGMQRRYQAAINDQKVAASNARIDCHKIIIANNQSDINNIVF